MTISCIASVTPLTHQLPMSSNHQRGALSPLGLTVQNRSTASIASEAATFHSAQAAPATEMERNIEQTEVMAPKPQADLTSTPMARADSGYEPGPERRSTSASSTRSRGARHSISSASTSTRPSTKRASRSTPSSSIHRTSSRPSVQPRHTNPSRGRDIQRPPQPPYEFFQFPSLSPPTLSPATTSLLPQPQRQTSLSSEDSSSESHPPPPPPPPATVHYFLLPETRRLEYAAIDAASRGVRGFITKLIPDCILPAEFRRPKFHSGDDDEESDAGSVRRYRISFPDPEEKGVGGERGNGCAGGVGNGKTRAWWKRVVRAGS